MSHAKDIDEHKGREAELMLVDLLYGELEGDAETQAQKRVQDGELSGELAHLRELRGLLRELPDEEPPAGVTAKLLHAAALHAPVKTSGAGAAGQDRKGFFSWISSLFRPIAMYPGLAAAASLMLVVGVAGTLYLSGREQVVTPKAPPSQSAAMPMTETMATPMARIDEQGADKAPARPTDSNAAGSEAWNADLAEGRGNMAAAAQAPAPDSDGVTQAVKAARARDFEPAEPAKKSKARATSKVAKDVLSSKMRDAKGGLPAGVYEDELDGYFDKSAALGSSGGSQSKASSGRGHAETKKAEPMPESQQAPSRQPVYRPPADTAKADDAPASAPQEAESDSVAEEKAKNDSARIRSLHDEARMAAKQGDCETVRSIANSIRQLDASYYKKTFQRDKIVAKCLTSVAR